MCRVPINRILPMSVVDGPGNRVAIFLQGCNIQCIYCHNPETQRICNGCRVCIESCPQNALSMNNKVVIWDSDKCVQCDNCIVRCPNYSSPKIKWMSAKEVFQKVLESVPFIRGITVSGGECMLYTDFLTELFRLCKEVNLTCLIDTNGMVKFEEDELLSLADGVMLDVKSWEKDCYKSLTGKSNDVVKSNIEFLASRGKLLEVRVVCLKDYVDAERVLDGLGKVLSQEVKDTLLLKLIRFRTAGVKVIHENMIQPSDSYMENLKEKALLQGFRNIRIL